MCYQKPFKQEICSLHDRLWTFLLQTFYAVRHTQGWESLSPRHRERILADAIDTGDNRKLGKKPVFSSSQPRVVKCPPPAPESPSTNRTQSKHVSSIAKTTSSSQNSPSAMKPDALGTAPKPGDGPKTKSVKKTADRAVATKSKPGATPVVNGTSSRRDVVSANGPRSATGTKDHEKKPNPGARPKTSPNLTSTAESPGSKVQKTKSDGAAAQATSTSGSASPETGASSPKNDVQSVPAAKPKRQVKTVNKTASSKAPQKTDSGKTSSSTNKPSARETSKVKTVGSEKAAAGVSRGDAKGKATADNQACRNGSSVKKPPSPKDTPKQFPDKTATEAPKKKTTSKPASASAPAAKPSAKPSSTKAPSVNAKQSTATTAKPGPKPKTTASETASPKSNTKTTATAATKKSTTKEKDGGNVKNHDVKSEVVTVRTGELTEQKDTKVVEGVEEKRIPVESKGDANVLQLDLKEESTLEKGAINVVNVQAAKPTPEVKSTNAEILKPAMDSKAKLQSSLSNQASNTNSSKDTDGPISSAPCSIGSTPLEDSWSGMHPQITPESETGSQATSSDDIKPRSEDYDAGGSQDDDFSNDRGGVSKCGTMRCHDFLGRSSSDTSTPEELKMYEGGLRVEVRMRGRDVETTSDEEAIRQDRPRSWLHRDEIQAEEEHSEIEATVTVKSVPEHQLFSSEDEEEEEEETEDEKSEVEVIPIAESSPHFQGIVNLAFDDETLDQENQEQYQATASNFRRSVLLSVDECEELGEEASLEDPQQKPDAAATTPCDVFEPESTIPENEEEVEEEKVDHLGTLLESKTDKKKEDKSVFLTELQEQTSQVDHPPCPSQDPPQERPCHLDLRNAEYYSNGLSRKNPTETKKAELHLDLNEPHLASRQGAQSPSGNV